MADYGRRSRKGGEGGGAADALAQLAACRRRKEEAGAAAEGGVAGKRRIDTFKVREEEKVYDEVSEAEYARIVAQKRAEAGDFVVGDEELGYNDIGEDDWHRYEEGQDDSDDEDLSESRQKKAKKIAASRARANAGQKRTANELAAAAALTGKNRGVSSMFAAAAASRASKGGPETAGRSIGIGANLGGKKGLVGAEDADDILNSIMADLEKDDPRDRRRRRVCPGGTGTVRIAAPAAPPGRGPGAWAHPQGPTTATATGADTYTRPMHGGHAGYAGGAPSEDDAGPAFAERQQGSREPPEERSRRTGAGAGAGEASAGGDAGLASGGAEKDGGGEGQGPVMGRKGAKEGGKAGESCSDASKAAVNASDSLAAEKSGVGIKAGQGGESGGGVDGAQAEGRSRGEEGGVGSEGRGNEGEVRKNQAMNATVEDTDGGDVARASWHSSKRGTPQGASDAHTGAVKAAAGVGTGADHADTAKDALEMPTAEDGSVPFYFLDAHEEAYGQLQGTVFLFGKVPQGGSYVSCCVMVKEMQRSLFVVPKPGTFSHSELEELEERAEGGGEEERGALMTTLHTLAGPMKAEVADLLMDREVNCFSMAPVRRSYAFENPSIPRGAGYCLKLKYPYKCPALPHGISGETFTTILGTHTSALELLLLKRKVMGPCWLSIKGAERCPLMSQKSHCKVELWVGDQKGVSVSVDQREMPPLTVASISLKTVVNSLRNTSEVAAFSVVHCGSVRADRPMAREEWDSAERLGHFSAFRRLEGVAFPVGLDSELAKKAQAGGAGGGGGAAIGKKGSERELLSYLLARLARLDADVLVGHGLSTSDLEILLTRMQLNKVGNWSVIGRLRRSQMPKLFGSGGGGGGAGPGVLTALAGRLLCDTALSAKEVLREVSYSLTHLAQTQLKTGRRVEISAAQVPGTYGTAESLIQMVEVNETDAWLSLALMFHLSALPLTRQLTNLSGNLWGKTLQGNRAQRIEYLLLHEFYRRKYLLPDKLTAKEKEAALAAREKVAVGKKQKQRKGQKGGSRKVKGEAAGADGEAGQLPTIDEEGEGGGEEAGEEEEGAPEDNHETGQAGKGGGRKAKKGPSYAGGLVLEPKRGLYDKYILLLDFNSLYPSIIQEFNICFTTVSPCAPRDADGTGAGGGGDGGGGGSAPSLPPLPDLEPTGVLPQVLSTLVRRRRQVKELMKKEADPAERQRLDIRQQALKLTANSMYGCLGFANSRFFAKPLAELVTSLGREILQNTVSLVQNTLNLEVIYGDTDSIMINTGLVDGAEVLQLGQKIKKEVNKRYKLLEIDIDGIFKRMLLLQKKKYAAVKLDLGSIGAPSDAAAAAAKEVIEQKGLDIVRRDWSILAKKTGNYCLAKILSGASVEEVLEIVHSHLRELAESVRQGKEPLTSFAISRALTKDPADYPDAKALPHVQVALRRLREGQREGCRAGDTVQYVICKPRGHEGPPVGGIAERARSIQELKAASALEAQRTQQQEGKEGEGERGAGGGEGEGEAEQWDVDVEYYLAHQVHPVVCRLVATIEGTNPARLAECLGLDPTKYRQSVHSSAPGGGASSDEALLSALSARDDEDRFRDCEPLWLTCPCCTKLFAFGGVQECLRPTPHPSPPSSHAHQGSPVTSHGPAGAGASQSPGTPAQGVGGRSDDPSTAGPGAATATGTGGVKIEGASEGTGTGNVAGVGEEGTGGGGERSGGMREGDVSMESPPLGSSLAQAQAQGQGQGQAQGSLRACSAPQHALHCPDCSDPRAVVTGGMLVNQVKLQLSKLLANFYEAWMKCNDDNCGVRTRDVCIAESPHAEDGVRKGHVCPRPFCEGTMIREFPEGLLYKQLQSFTRLLDAQAALKRITDPRLKMEAKLRLDPVAASLQKALGQVLKIANESKYKWVSMDSICVSVPLSFTQV